MKIKKHEENVTTIEEDVLELQDVDIDGSRYTVQCHNSNGLFEIDFNSNREHIDSKFTLTIHGGKIVVSRQRSDGNGYIVIDYLLQSKKDGKVFWGKDPHITATTIDEYRTRPKNPTTVVRGSIEEQNVPAYSKKVKVFVPKIISRTMPKPVSIDSDYFLIPFGA